MVPLYQFVERIGGACQLATRFILPVGAPTRYGTKVDALLIDGLGTPVGSSYMYAK